MKLKTNVQYTLNADYESIDRFSQWLLENLTSMGADKRTATKARLLLEEILLRVHDSIGEQVQMQVLLSHSIVGASIKIVMPGEAFNPLSEVNDEMGEWNSSLQTAIGLNPKYSYSWGGNVLKLKIPKRKMNPVLLIFAAICLGVILGLLGHFVLPGGARAMVTDYFLTPAYELWLKMLNAISGPIIFFTVITTMLNTRKIDAQGGNSTNAVLRYFGISFLITALAFAISYPFYFGSEIFKLNVYSAEKILASLGSLIPENVVAPFFDSNTPQLILIAFVIGAAVIALGSRVAQVKTLLRQINMVGLKLAQWVSLLVPLFAGLFIALEIIEGQTNVLRNMYQPLLISVCAALLLMALALLYVAARVRMRPLGLCNKMKKPFLIALKTGSLDASTEQTRYSCIHLLGIDKTFTGISLPQGLVLYMPVSAVGTLIFTMYAANVYHVDVDIFWLVCAILFAVILFVATPPVPGANLLAYVVFFNWLGIPGEALMDAMIFDIVFGILAGAGNQMLLQAELLLQAKKLGVLDRTRLA